MTRGRQGPREEHADEIDPRRIRSRNRLLDAAAALLGSDGPESVTVEAVTRISGVAKTTLYRHFDNAVQLRAATLERMLPPPLAEPPPGPLRERLVALLHRQAETIGDAPLHLSSLAWLATGTARSPELSAVRARLIERYRVPFDAVLDTPAARAEIGDIDIVFALSQLVGPLVFAKLVGTGPSTQDDCVRLVDDFLAARAADRASGRPVGVDNEAG